MADAVAPVSLMASATLAKTGLPRCSEPAFLGFVPPTTFVPGVSCQLLFSFPLQSQVVGWAHTVLDGLLCVETVPALAVYPDRISNAAPLTFPAFQ